MYEMKGITRLVFYSLPPCTFPFSLNKNQQIGQLAATRIGDEALNPIIFTKNATSGFLKGFHEVLGTKWNFYSVEETTKKDGILTKQNVEQVHKMEFMTKDTSSGSFSSFLLSFQTLPTLCLMGTLKEPQQASFFLKFLQMKRSVQVPILFLFEQNGVEEAIKLTKLTALGMDHIMLPSETSSLFHSHQNPISLWYSDEFVLQDRYQMERDTKMGTPFLMDFALSEKGTYVASHPKVKKKERLDQKSRF